MMWVRVGGPVLEMNFNEQLGRCPILLLRLHSDGLGSEPSIDFRAGLIPGQLLKQV
ncbi:hypothetical protein M6B38_257790 [Iris pallida]|uniref:DUF4283 domain-containing protein n=1 Tax=Iris pallida TaxID=29817 RepID=A0AAX6GQ73_IRIPA|nr:hypothetical protein M6B38_351175 [Iris pallida]KAJ6851887.1 hypothetical protein M6B38_257790 [Iris pallida]